MSTKYTRYSATNSDQSSAAAGTAAGSAAAGTAPEANTIQDAVDETKIDYNALDNTLGGQLIQAGFIFAILAARSAPTRLALGAANLATIGVFNAFAEDQRHDLTARVEAEQGEQESVALSWGLLGGVAAGAVAAGAVASRTLSGMADWLGRRGVAKPNALLGAAGAAAYIAAKQRRS